MSELEKAFKKNYTYFISRILWSNEAAQRIYPGISISDVDKKYGVKGYIAVNKDDQMDKWFVSEDYFNKNYEFKDVE